MLDVSGARHSHQLLFRLKFFILPFIHLLNAATVGLNHLLDCAHVYLNLLDTKHRNTHPHIFKGLFEGENLDLRWG